MVKDSGLCGAAARRGVEVDGGLALQLDERSEAADCAAFSGAYAAALDERSDAADCAAAVDERHSVKDFSGAYAAAQRGVELHGGLECVDVELLWRSARAHYDAHSDSSCGGASREPETLLREGIALSQRAIDADGAHWGGHKWCAICLGSLNSFGLSLRERIVNSWSIREHLDKAHDILPSDATINHAIGVWCFEVASLGWVERGLANTFVSTLPSASFDEALSYFEIAAASWASIHTCVKAADACEKLGRKTDAQEWLRRACAQEATGESEAEAQREARRRLK